MYTQPKKMFPPENTFFSFDHISVISWVWMENLISLESRYSKLFIVQIFFCILKIFWVINFWTKIVYFFPISKNMISPVRIKKIFFLWKLVVALIILQKSFWKKMWALMTIWWSEYECDFQTSEFPLFC